MLLRTQRDRVSRCATDGDDRLKRIFRHDLVEQAVSKTENVGVLGQLAQRTEKLTEHRIQEGVDHDLDVGQDDRPVRHGHGGGQADDVLAEARPGVHVITAGGEIQLGHVVVGDLGFPAEDGVDLIP